MKILIIILFSLLFTLLKAHDNSNPVLYEYLSGTKVELTAIPNDGWIFVEWAGDISSQENPITIEMTQDVNVIARFEEISTDIEEITHLDPIIYPNPFYTFIIIDNIQDFNRIIFINSIGQIMKDIKISSLETTTISTDDLSRGIYFIVLQNKDGTRIITRIVKQ